jgi:CBS domain-containing protein
MVRAGEVMRRVVEFCVPETRAPDMRYLMKRYNYDDLLVVDNMNEKHLVGVVHQRAISDEILKNVLHPFDVMAKNCMEKMNTTVLKTSSAEECLDLMEKTHMSLIPVVDAEGHCLGIVKKDDLV